MKIASGIKKVVKPFVDVPSWIGYRQLADATKAIRGLFVTVFIPQKTEQTEDFAAAMARLKLTEADLQQRAKEFKRLVILFAVISCGVFAYAIYLFLTSSWKGGLVGLAMTSIVLAYTFRYHFWLFQVRQRRLGCTLRDWWSSSFIGTKK